MPQKSRSKFEKFIMEQIGEKSSQVVHEQMGLPSHPITKAYKDPENSPHHVVIAFAELLELHPYELITNHKLGSNRLYENEIEYHRREYELQHSLSAA